MRPIPSNVKHGAAPFKYAIARGFQKAAYFGFRAIIVLFLITIIGTERSDALYWYGAFTGFYIIAQFVGALFSDLMQKNKEVMFLGVILQVFGAILVVVMVKFWLVGLVLFAIGGALFEDNQTTLFGRLYQRKEDLLDAGFSLLIVAVNIGAMLGILLVGYLFEAAGYHIAFLIAASLSGIAGLAMIGVDLPHNVTAANSTENDLLDDDFLDSTSMPTSKNKSSFWILGIVLCILALTIGVPLSSGLYDLQVNLMDWNGSIATLGSFISLGFGILLTIFWSFNYNSQYAKMLIGLCLFGVFYLLLLNIDGKDELLFFVLLTTLFEVAYLFFGPIVFSLITKNTQPRFRATFYALSRIPEKLLTYFGLTALVFSGLSQIWGLAILALLLGAAFFLYSRHVSFE